MDTSHPAAKAPLSAPGRGEGRGEVGEMLSSDTAHLTLPSLRDGPSLSPRKRAERGQVPRHKMSRRTCVHVLARERGTEG
jgi:hypothetical protein